MKRNKLFKAVVFVAIFSVVFPPSVAPAFAESETVDWTVKAVEVGTGDPVEGVDLHALLMGRGATVWEESGSTGSDGMHEFTNAPSGKTGSVEVTDVPSGYTSCKPDSVRIGGDSGNDYAHPSYELIITCEPEAPQDIEIEAKALVDHSCNVDEWHFLITGIEGDVEAPEAIEVEWSNGKIEQLALDRVTGKTAHYYSYDYLDATVVSASAVISENWDGQFNLSHGPDTCETPNNLPTIELYGDNPLMLCEGNPYSEPGYKAHDEEDGDITPYVVVGGDTITENTSPGDYNISYESTDSDYNTVSANRDVTVLPKNDNRCDGPPPDNPPGGGGGGGNDDPEKGSLRICKMVYDGSMFVDGADKDGVFTVNPHNFGYDNSEMFESVVFETPLNLNADLFHNDGINDAECHTQEDLKLGSYGYEEELIDGEGWLAPLYNDQFQTEFQSSGGAFLFDDALFTENTEDDEGRNYSSDGDILLTKERPDRTLIVKNRYVPEENQPPEVEIVGASSLCVSDSIVLTASSTDPDGDVVLYEWDWGDGATSTGATSSHMYSATGTYEVMLTVTDDDGATSTATTIVKARTCSAPPQDPELDVVGVTTIGVCDTLSLSASSSQEFYSFEWDLGDGATTTGSTIEHTYGSTGTYTVTLTGYYGDGLSTTTSVTVTVESCDTPPPGGGGGGGGGSSRSSGSRPQPQEPVEVAPVCTEADRPNRPLFIWTPGIIGDYIVHLKHLFDKNTDQYILFEYHNDTPGELVRTHILDIEEGAHTVLDLDNPDLNKRIVTENISFTYGTHGWSNLWLNVGGLTDPYTDFHIYGYNSECGLASERMIVYDDN